MHVGERRSAQRAVGRDLDGRICTEFREMPGLCITTRQAARLFGLDPVSCERVLDSLVTRGVLFTDGRVFHLRAGARVCV
jgi:hypothetical protein